MLDAARQTQDVGRMTGSIDSAVTQIELSIRNLQALITELRPAALDQIGLGPALEALLKRVSATSGLHIDSDVQLAAEPRLDPEIERTVYRLIQESLTNVIKHADAAQVRLALAEAAGNIDLQVVDDGVGFAQDQINAGFGLVGMQDRVALVGGKVSIDSSPGSGTTVRAQIPARRLAAEGEAPDAGTEGLGELAG